MANGKKSSLGTEKMCEARKKKRKNRFGEPDRKTTPPEKPRGKRKNARRKSQRVERERGQNKGKKLPHQEKKKRNRTGRGHWVVGGGEKIR